MPSTTRPKTSSRSVGSRAREPRAAAAQKSDRRQDILDAALACFNDSGLEPTTIEMIRERCGASVGSIYHHFGSKEGIAAALFFGAMEDQSAELARRLGRAADVEAALKALVLSYVDWVTAHPDLARFLYQARGYVAKGPHADELARRNRAHFGALFGWFETHAGRERLLQLPAELYPALIIGAAESYCRAWLSGRVKVAPAVHGPLLAEAAWRALRRVPD